MCCDCLLDRGKPGRSVGQRRRDVARQPVDRRADLAGVARAAAAAERQPGDRMRGAVAGMRPASLVGRSALGREAARRAAQGRERGVGAPEGAGTGPTGAVGAFPWRDDACREDPDVESASSLDALRAQIGARRHRAARLAVQAAVDDRRLPRSGTPVRRPDGRLAGDVPLSLRRRGAVVVVELPPRPFGASGERDRGEVRPAGHLRHRCVALGQSYPGVRPGGAVPQRLLREAIARALERSRGGHADGRATTGSLGPWSPPMPTRG